MQGWLMRRMSNEGHWTQWDTVERATAQEAAACPPIPQCCATLSKSLLLSRVPISKHRSPNWRSLQVCAAERKGISRGLGGS